MTDCLSLRERYFPPGDGNPAAAEWQAHLRGCRECQVAYQGLPQVDRVLDEIANAPVSVPSFDAIAKAAAGAARHQRRRATVRRSVPYLYTGLGAALAAGILIAVLVGRSGVPKLLAAGVELRATTEAKSARLENGARIRLDAGRLKLASASQQHASLLLPLGRVVVDVPKLPPGATLSVRTPDAEVRVHGTRFQVIRTSKNTQVQVFEGVVEVRPEGIGRPLQTVRAGESATVGSAEAYREGLRRSTLAALDHGEFSAAEKQIGQLLGSTAEAAQQAEAQALLAWSLAARGKRGDAVARYRQALTLLPDGQQPLWAENACAELAILVEQESPKSSGATWAECLRRFPSGVHAASARSRINSTR